MLEAPSVIEREGIDQDVQSRLDEQRREYAEDIEQLCLNKKKLSLSVRDDGLHIYKGPADGNIQVRFFEECRWSASHDN